MKPIILMGDLNSVSSFFKASYLVKVRKPSFSYCLPTVREIRDDMMIFCL